jgi:hypothetical protein
VRNEHSTEAAYWGVSWLYSIRWCCLAAFEGQSGHDIHVNGINAGSPASHLAHLRHGMLLKRVQDVDVTELSFDEALARVTNSSRPLKLHFYDREWSIEFAIDLITADSS